MESYHYKVVIEYLGTYLGGWQRQKDVLSVQEVLEDAVLEFANTKTQFLAAGRTDAGVHAYAQVAHFDLPKFYDPYRLMHTINHFSRRHNVGIIACEQVKPDFHARFSAKMRHYVYKIINRKQIVILEKGLKYWVREDLDISKMQKGAEYLLGHHDFSSFRSSICQSKSPMKTLDKIVIQKNGEEILIFVSAISFLHHMVRNIVGSLIPVGIGTWEPSKISEILELRNRAKAGPTAPAEGLYFLKIDY